MLSRTLQFSSVSLFCSITWVVDSSKNSCESLECSRNWYWTDRVCCGYGAAGCFFFFYLLCLGFITWLSGGALLSKDVAKLKSGTHWHLGCWNDAERFPEGCCSFAQLSLWNLALASGIFSIKQSLRFFFFHPPIAWILQNFKSHQLSIPWQSSSVKLQK